MASSPPAVAAPTEPVAMRARLKVPAAIPPNLKKELHLQISTQFIK